jgi:hypothetical protein
VAVHVAISCQNPLFVAAIVSLCPAAFFLLAFLSIGVILGFSLPDEMAR